MALPKYPSVLFLFYVLWIIALLLALTAPENKYEWMFEVEHFVSRSNLPEDPDADMRTFLFYVPAIAFALMNFALSKWIFENSKVRNLSMLAGMLTLLVVTIRIL